MGSDPSRDNRLPTEAEWKYAERESSTTKYCWGDEINQNDKAWANCGDCGSQWGYKQTAPVGSFEANAFFLYDKAGNVWEWTQDCWHDNNGNAPTDGSASLDSDKSDCSLCVIRGGFWYFNHRYLRSGSHGRVTPDNQSSTGFRLAQDL